MDVLGVYGFQCRAGSLEKRILDVLDGGIVSLEQVADDFSEGLVGPSFHRDGGQEGGQGG